MSDNLKCAAAIGAVLLWIGVCVVGYTAATGQNDRQRQAIEAAPESPAPRPVSASEYTAHLTDSEYLARPANKMGVVESEPTGWEVIPESDIPRYDEAPKPLVAAMVPTAVSYDSDTIYREFVMPQYVALGGARKRVCRNDEGEAVECKDGRETKEEVAVSEPPSIALILAGFVGLLIARRIRHDLT